MNFLKSFVYYKDINQQPNTNAILSTQESKTLDYILMCIPTSVLNYRQEIPSFKLQFLFSFLQHCN